MKKSLPTKLALIFVATFFNYSSFAQEGDKNVKQKITDEKGNPSLITFNEKSSYRTTNYQQIFKDQLRLKDNSSFEKINSDSDRDGFLHEKFQLFQNGVKVEFATYTLHSKNGELKSMSGEFYSLDNVNTNPTLSNQQAFDKAIRQIGAKSYLWENPIEAAAFDYSKPVGELVLLPVSNELAKKGEGNLRLAYKFDIYASNPASRGDLYIDAVSGEALFYNATIKHIGEHSHGKSNSVSENSPLKTNNLVVAGNADTRYSGTQSIETTLSGSSYILADATRGSGVNTYNSQRLATYTNVVNFTDANNTWTAAEFNNTNKDNGALDAHWGAEKTYDYWSIVHGRNSFNNAGAAIKSYVHYNLVAAGYSSNNNAFWNGSVMTYGDGTGTGGFDILTSVDVAAHEIGHAVCTYTANLAYQKESGAMNEAFSDIWGACVEYYADPTKSTWLIGEDIERRSGHLALRSMSNPKSEGQPDTYGGTNWINVNCTPSSNNDYCGVHTNSGVLNHWFYILTIGKTGTNDIGSSYSVSGIGIDKAAKIAYRTESVYLSANSTYANARTYGIQSAIDLYGAGSAEVIATTNAFYAVGIGAAYAGSSDTQAPTTPTNLIASGTTSSSTNLSWNASTDNVGVTGYNVYQGTTLLGSATSTSYTVTGLSGSTTYSFTVKAKDAAGNLSAVSNTATVTTLVGSTTYCTSQGNNTADERIGRVVFGSIDNTSTGAAGYEDFTSFSTSVAQGSTNTITITPSWTASVYSEGYAVFIDYNQDGDFADAGETVWTKATSTATPATGSFTIPATATLGTTRMRVSMKYNGVPTSCEAFTYGQVEDYTVNITGTTADTQAPTAPTNLVAYNVAQTSATLSWTASTDNVGVTGYDVYQGTTNIGTITTSTSNITGLTASTSYTFSVKAKDAAGNTSASSNTVSFTTTGGSTGNSTTTLHEGYFETGWDGWSDGGSDCARYAGSRSYEGNYSIYVRDNSGTASAMTSPSFNLSSYDSVEFKFYFYANSMENGEDFWVRFYNGSTWTTVATYVSGTSFNNNTFYSATVNLTSAQYNFATNSQFRIQCDASANDDLVYIDQVTVKGIIGTGIMSNSITPLFTPTTLSFESNDVAENKVGFTISPNPVVDLLNVNISSENAKYSIINLLGQTVLRGNVTPQGIDVSYLNNGVYVIEITDGEEINSQKFIKK